MLKVTCVKKRTFKKTQKTNIFSNTEKLLNNSVFIDNFKTSHIITRLFITVSFN